MKLNHKEINTKFCGLDYIKISNSESVSFCYKEYIEELMQMGFSLLFSYFPITTKSAYFTDCEN